MGTVCRPPWTWPSTISLTTPAVNIGGRGCSLFCSVCEVFDDGEGNEMFITAMPKTEGNDPVHSGGGGDGGDINAVTACLGRIGEAYA